MTYEVIGSVTGLVTGQHVTDEQLEKDHKALGGADRLIASGAIRPATGPAPVGNAGDPNLDPALTAGHPEPLRKDMDRAEADAINHGTNPGDAAERRNPAGGDPGSVARRGRPVGRP